MAANATNIAITHEEDINDIDTLRDGQEITLYLLTMISATISMVGSSSIVHKVVRNWNMAVPYDRFLLGLSCCDILASGTFFITPFLLPQDTSLRAWASGNEGTCTALGFFTQFSYSAFVYNGILSFYYLLTVRYGIKRQLLARRYEPWMHLTVLGFFLTTAAVGAAIGLYNELDLGPGCWIRDYPKGCYEVGGCTGHYFGWVFTGLPTLFTLFAVIINNVIIYFHVKRIFGATDESQELGTSVFQQRMSQRHKQQIKAVAQQGFLYVASFFLCYSCQFALRVLETSSFAADEKEGDVYWLLVLDAFLRPLQGFVNLLVYTRPNYVKIRDAFPERSNIWALRQAVNTPDIPKLISSLGRSTVPHRQSERPGSGGIRPRHDGMLSPFSGGGSNSNNRNHTTKSHKSGSYFSDLPVVSEGSNESSSSDDEEMNSKKRKLWGQNRRARRQEKKRKKLQQQQQEVEKKRNQCDHHRNNEVVIDPELTASTFRECPGLSYEESSRDSRNADTISNMSPPNEEMPPLSGQELQKRDEEKEGNQTQGYKSLSSRRLGMDGAVH